MNQAHGQIRSSQVITSFGPGALIDLPQDSAIVGGLDSWPRTSDLEEIQEPRLERKVRNMTGVAAPEAVRATAGIDRPGPACPGDRGLALSRVVRCAGRGRWRQPGAIAPAGASKGVGSEGRFDGHEVVATRFVRACPNGHVDDLDWWYFVHEGNLPCKRQLWLDERSTGGDLGDLVVRCGCGKRRSVVRGDAAGDESPRLLPGGQALAGPQCQRGLRSAEPAPDPDGLQRLLPAGRQRTLPSGPGKRRRAGGAVTLGLPDDGRG